MKRPLKYAALILCLIGPLSLNAQFSAPGGLPAGFHHALLDVLGTGPAFSGRARITMGTEVMNASVAVLSGDMRLEVDSFIPGTNFPKAELPNVANIHTVTISRPDTNRMFLVYPAFSSYVELAYGKATGMDPTPAPTINKTPAGPETVGDRVFGKSIWSVTEANGEHYDLTVWSATNGDSFPVQIKVGRPAALVEFQEVSYVPPDPNLFVPPSNYYKYEGIQELILKSTLKPEVTNSP